MYIVWHWHKYLIAYIRNNTLILELIYGYNGNLYQHLSSILCKVQSNSANLDQALRNLEF